MIKLVLVKAAIIAERKDILRGNVVPTRKVEIRLSKVKDTEEDQDLDPNQMIEESVKDIEAKVQVARRKKEEAETKNKKTESIVQRIRKRRNIKRNTNLLLIPTHDWCSSVKIKKLL